MRWFTVFAVLAMVAVLAGCSGWDFYGHPEFDFDVRKVGENEYEVAGRLFKCAYYEDDPVIIWIKDGGYEFSLQRGRPAEEFTVAGESYCFYPEYDGEEFLFVFDLDTRRLPEEKVPINFFYEKSASIFRLVERSAIVLPE